MSQKKIDRNKTKKNKNNNSPPKDILEKTNSQRKMLIAVKCFTCGKVVADCYHYYLAQVAQRKLARQHGQPSPASNKVVYLTKEFAEKTPEGEVLDELGFNKMCCRRQILCQPMEDA